MQLAADLSIAANAYPKRMIALRLRDLPLDYNHLNSVQRTRTRDFCGSADSPAAYYERAVCEFIDLSLNLAGPRLSGRFGISGIPFEAYGRSTASANMSNAHYSQLVNRVDVLLPARSFILSKTTATPATVKNSIPVSMAHANARKVLVRVNHLWIDVSPPPPPPPPPTEASETGTSSGGMTWTAYHAPQAYVVNSQQNDTTLTEGSSPLATSSETPEIETEPSENEALEGPQQSLAVIVDADLPEEIAWKPTVYDESGFWNEEANSTAYTDEEIGLDEEEIADLSLEGFRQAWPTSDLTYDLNSDGTVNVTDLDVLTDIIAPPSQVQHKRLLHFQSVGYSSLNEFGYVSPSTCTPESGWNAHIEHRLQDLVDRLGNDAFDWWGHNTGGVWDHCPITLVEDGTSTLMRYDQLLIARYRYPRLVNFEPLKTFADDHGINLYGYIGFPLCHSGSTNTGRILAFDQRPEHGDPDQFLNWYREFVEYGFTGVGHDWTSTLKSDSSWLENIVPILQQLNMEVLVEATIRRNTGDHLLGLSVVAEHRVWTMREDLRDSSGSLIFYSEHEIREAGGRAIHLITWPEGGRQGEIANEPGFDIWEWRFKTSKRLLRDGHTVAVNLHGLLSSGHNIDKLVELSRDTGYLAQSDP